MTKPSKPTLWSEDKPNVTTIIPELAEEIGLNESLVLRQIVFWINISDNLRDDEWWTYQSLSDMKEKAFPYFSVSTLSRTVNKLVEKGLINKTDKYNKRKNDRTTWYSINYEGVRQLKSVKLVLQNEKSPKASNDGILQNETTILHIEKPMLQNETTLPDYNTDYKQQKQDINIAPETDNDISTDEETVEDKPQDNPDEVSKETNKLARGLIAVYLKTTKTVNSSAYRFWMKEAQELAERDITPAHVAEWVKDITAQEWWSSGMPTWGMMCQKIVSWRDEYEAKKNKPTIDRRLQARKLPVNIDMLTGDQSA